VAIHPRISVNNLSSMSLSLAEDIGLWRELGVEHVGLITPKLEALRWDAARELVAGAKLRVSNVAAEARVLPEALAFAGAVGAGSVYTCTGGIGKRTWDEAVAAHCAEIAPLVARARRLGVRLAIEPTNPLRTDLSFVFTFRDAVDLARASGVDIVLDLYSCWYERGLADLVRKNLERVALVQISDYVLGTLDTPNRAVIGDGDVPLERLLGELLDAGYEGAFDLEILGPRIEKEGYRSAVGRSVERASEILERLGA
jgi:sugar phosphate isomerase/epimerase